MLTGYIGGAVTGLGGGGYAGWETAGYVFDSFAPEAGLAVRFVGYGGLTLAGMSIGSTVGAYGGSAAGAIAAPALYIGATKAADGYRAGKSAAGSAKDSAGNAKEATLERLGFADEEELEEAFSEMEAEEHDDDLRTDGGIIEPAYDALNHAHAEGYEL